MQVKYFQDTDTVYILLSEKKVVETRDLDENTLLDLDLDGNLVGMTVEHASRHTDIANFSYQQISATTQGIG